MALKNLRFWCAKPETVLIGLQIHATPSELKKRNPPAVRETMAGESYCLKTSAREEVKLFRCSIRRVEEYRLEWPICQHFRLAVQWETSSPIAKPKVILQQ